MGYPNSGVRILSFGVKACCSTSLPRYQFENQEPICAAAAVTTVAFLLSAPVRAQWLNYKTPDIPRTPDGKPDLSVPVPRTADGKPDLSGIWRAPRNNPYLRNIAADLKPGEIQPWAPAPARGPRRLTQYADGDIR